MTNPHVTDPDDQSSNPSDNPELADVLELAVSRRKMLGGGLAAATLGFFGGTAGSVLGAAPAAAHPAGGGRRGRGRAPLLGFASVPTSSADRFVVADGYVAEVLIPWGTPLRTGGPAWKADGTNTAAEQSQQIGMHHDGMHFFPLGRGPRASERGLLVVNHEYTAAEMIYTDGGEAMTQEKVDKALAGHGVSVVEVALTGGKWRLVDSAYNRRVTGATPMAFSGPVSLGNPDLQSNNPALGTLNNCAHGSTPWGTYLACEENFNGYFGTADASFAPNVHQRRYGLDAVGFGYRWHLADPRFDIAKNPKEANRFGWVVEIDPFDPRSTPTKRTALGRVKHEGACVVESRGRVVVYTGDDQDKDYVYKFVGRDAWQAHLARGESPLDQGTLYVARFNDDGTGQWSPLVFGQGPLTVANGWVDQADVMIRTRQAADTVGATKLDRPEWVAVNPQTNDVFLTLTNGSSGVNPPNPRNPNPYGSIMRWREANGDHTALTFVWDIFVLAGDPSYDPKVNVNGDIFGSPDGLWVDHDGRLWVQTDISNSSQLLATRGYDKIGNNQMLAADPATGEIRRFLTGPRGCEITGVITTPDQQTMFVNVQHPGEFTTAIGTPTPANPRAVSNWPDFDPAGRPRSATVVIRKIGGGVIGT